MSLWENEQREREGEREGGRAIKEDSRETEEEER